MLETSVSGGAIGPDGSSDPGSDTAEVIAPVLALERHQLLDNPPPSSIVLQPD